MKGLSEQWHEMDTRAAVIALGSDASSGLAPAEVERRRAAAGPNALATQAGPGWWAILLDQFKDFMVLVLLGATAVSYWLGEVTDALTIVAIVILNAVLGFFQEYRAERSLAALRRLAAPTARVRRGAAEALIAAAELVPGDLVLLEAGDRVPADCRLLLAAALAADESALTGESLPVAKDAAWQGAANTPLGDRRNCVYMGTVLTRGRAEAVVTATGMQTEMGAIAGLMQGVQQEQTPLQRRLEQLGRWLILACLGVCALVAVTGVLRGEPVHAMFLAGVSLAVAAVPEGLPAIVTVALALGVQRMIRRGAIVRRLQAVETLGCATVICSDKTGTLTKNEMMVRALYAGGRHFAVSGDGYRPLGEFNCDGEALRPLEDAALAQCLRSAALCSNARLVHHRGDRKRFARKGEGGGEWQVQGDPTEAALVVAAAKGGFTADKLAAGWERVSEVPFEAERRRMAVITRGRETGALAVHVKGAPDVLLERCTTYAVGGRQLPLDAAARRAILAAAEAMAGQALRVLAIAWCPLPGPQPPDDPEAELVFLGLAGLIDPPRPEVRAAVATAAGAGVRTVMITGDHPATALAVARELGIAGPAAVAVTGAALEAMDDAALLETVATARVFARVSPAHKLRIVRALRQRGEVAAMTGDGVNDAPAVKEADIGIAMGRGGTDVTKEASAMVLADDNYATIVAAVHEGRAIYDNIRKFIRYLLSCNTGEVLTMFLAALIHLPLPLLPGQVLWVNLVTDGLPAMALGVDPAEPDLMQRPPRRASEGVFARRLGIKILGRGLLIGLGTLGVFLWGLRTGNLAAARTMAFATLVLAQLLHAFDCRSEHRSIWEVSLWRNPYLTGAVALSTLMLLAAIYVPPLARAFQTVPLAPVQWLPVLVAASLGELFVGLRRLVLYRRIVRLRPHPG